MIYYFCGQPGSGKTTLAKCLQLEINHKLPAFNIDGDTVRVLTKNKNYSITGRIENIEFAHNLALEAHKQGLCPIISLVSPYAGLRNDFQEACRAIGIHIKLIQLIYNKEAENRGKEAYWVEGFEELTNNGLILNTSYLSISQCLAEILK